MQFSRDWRGKLADLAFLLFALNSASAALVAVREFLRRGGYLTLPFLTSLIFLTWYLPQAWALINFPSLSQVSLARLFFMSLVCFWAMVLGWHQGMGKWHRPMPLDLPVRRLLVPVYAITLFAIAMRSLIEMQPAEVRAMGQWTGIITIIAFFASVSVVSTALSMAMVLKTRNLATLVLFSLNLTIYLPLIFIYFRRTEAFEFGLGVLLSIFFVNGRTIPRAALLVLAIAGFFFATAVGQLRSLGGGYQIGETGTIEIRLPTLREIAEIDWLMAVDLSDSIYRSETMNAVVGMEAVAHHGSYTFGAQFWNRMVFSFIPGQFVGHDLKRSLMVGTNALEVAKEEMFFEAHTGTTGTGFLDPYQDFWFLGCVVWWLTGYTLGQFMQHALRGSLIAYTLYAATISNGMLVITHFGYFLFSQSALIVIAILLVRFWLRQTGSYSRQMPIRAPT